MNHQPAMTNVTATPQNNTAPIIAPTTVLTSGPKTMMLAINAPVTNSAATMAGSALLIAAR